MSNVIIHTIDDPETDIPVEFTQEDVRTLDMIEQRIAINLVQMSFDLKEIQERKLYLLRHCDSMREYVENHLHDSYRTVQRRIGLARRFSDVDKTQFKALSLADLQAIARDAELIEDLQSGDALIDGDKVVYSTGEVETLEDVKKRIQTDAQKHLKEELQEAKQTIKDKNTVINANEDKIEQMRLEYESTIAKQDRTINKLSHKEIDTATITLVSSRKDITTLIDSKRIEILQALGEIDNLPSSLFNAELSGLLQFSIASIEASLKNLKQHWEAMLYIDAEELGE